MNPTDSRIVVERVTLSRDECTIFDTLTLPPLRNGLVAMIGPNGVGKTSLLEAMAGLLPIQSGRILVDGLDVHHEDRDIRRLISLMVRPESLPMDLTPVDYWHIVGWARRRVSWRQESQDLARVLGMTRECDAMIGRLSYGNRVKVAVVGALVGDPSIVLLDEPFNGLDVGAQIGLRDLLKSRASMDRLSVVVDHSPAFAARHCTQIVGFNNRNATLERVSESSMSDDILALEAEIESFIMRACSE